jgi:anti-anti-sigma factor
MLGALGVVGRFWAALRASLQEGSMDMVVDELDGGITNVTLRGRLDFLGAQSIDLPFSEIADSKLAVLVDLSGVEYLASLGMRILLISAKAVHRKGGRLAMFVPEGNVLSALKAAGLDTVIPMFQERDDAIAAVGP